MVKSPIEKIMVYIDGSEESIVAAQLAVCYAKFMEAQLTAVYVINTRALNDLRKVNIFLEEEEAEYSHDLEADAQRYLNHVNELCRGKGVAVDAITLKGSVHQELVKTVKEKEIDILFIGELSRIRSRRDEFYDESERAMRSVDCSVMIAKDEEKVAALFDQIV